MSVHAHTGCRLIARFAAAWTLAGATPAAALQPLEVFVQAAHDSPENREAEALREQRRAEAKASRWHLAPSLTATGSYTRNQYERVLMLPGSSEPQAFLKKNQLDAAVTLSVPLIDVGAWEHSAAARARLDAASASEQATSLTVERRVTRAYYQLLASDAVYESAQQSLALAEENARVVRDKRSEGVATELALQRALSDVARAQQDASAAELAVVDARRRLQSLSGVEPQEVQGFIEDDLHAEAPLSRWLEASESVPAVQAARASETAAEESIEAARSAWYPTLSGSAQERYSNATALVGHRAYYAFELSVSWRLDAVTYHRARARRAEAAAAQARAERSRRDTEDAIFRAWHRVRSGIEQARAARAQAQAAARAAELARDQYAAGVATQLDLLAAREDAFRAEVARIQADADLAYGRAALRLYAGNTKKQSSP